MEETTEIPGVEAMTNALTPGKHKTELALAVFQAIWNPKQSPVLTFFRASFFREGGRDWDSNRKMDGDRAWQSKQTILKVLYSCRLEENDVMIIGAWLMWDFYGRCKYQYEEERKFWYLK